MSSDDTMNTEGKIWKTKELASGETLELLRKETAEGLPLMHWKLGERTTPALRVRPGAELVADFWLPNSEKPIGYLRAEEGEEKFFIWNIERVMGNYADSMADKWAVIG